MEDSTVLRAICGSLPVASNFLFVVGTLAFFNVIKYLDSAVEKLLEAIRLRFDLTIGNAVQKLGRVNRAAVLVGLLWLMPFALLELTVLFATRWHPSQLIFHPQYGLLALCVPLLIVLACWARPGIKQRLMSFYREDIEYAGFIVWCYLCLLVGLLAPPIVYHASGFVLPMEFFMLVVMVPFTAYYAYALGTMWIALGAALLGAMWIVVASVYFIVHNLDRHPRRALGAGAYLVSAAIRFADYLGVCASVSPGA